MPDYKFKCDTIPGKCFNVQAENQDEALKKVVGAIKVMRTACSQMSVKEFYEFALKIEANPNKVKLAKNFI